MAESDALVPYQTTRAIILRKRGAVIRYDPVLRSLIKEDEDESARHTSGHSGTCPTCYRPFDEPKHGEPTHTASFGTPEYFQLLSGDTGPQLESRRLSQSVSPPRLLPHDETSTQRSSVAGSPFADSTFISSEPQRSTTGISESSFSQGYFDKFFVEEKVLGRGGRGVVLLVRHVLDGVNLGHFAAKRIPIGDDHSWLERVLVEVQLLQHLSHKNLVSYRHVWLEHSRISVNAPPVPCAYILQQFCNQGDLFNYVCGQISSPTTEEMKDYWRKGSRNVNVSGHSSRKLQFEQIYSFFKDITSGLNHLHANNYIHRDLKPQNCLLHNTGKELRVLVSDFGEVQSEQQVRQNTGSTGTISYCAPEVLKLDPVTRRYGAFTTKSDVFSLGMILYFLCFASLPYEHADQFEQGDEDLEKLREEITSWHGLLGERSLRSDLPEKLYQFMDKLLAIDAVDRPSTEDVLQAIRTSSNLLPGRRPSQAEPGHVVEELRRNLRDDTVHHSKTWPSTTQARDRGQESSPDQLALVPHPTKNLGPTLRRMSSDQQTTIKSSKQMIRFSNPQEQANQTSYGRMRFPTLVWTSMSVLALEFVYLYRSCVPQAVDSNLMLCLGLVAFVQVLWQELPLPVLMTAFVFQMGTLLLAWQKGNFCVAPQAG